MNVFSVFSKARSASWLAKVLVASVVAAAATLAQPAELDHRSTNEFGRYVEGIAQSAGVADAIACDGHRSLIPGTSYRQRGCATGWIQGSGELDCHLQLAPAPEPEDWTLIALGMPWLPWRRRSVGRGPATPAEGGPRKFLRSPDHWRSGCIAIALAAFTMPSLALGISAATVANRGSHVWIEEHGATSDGPLWDWAFEFRSESSLTVGALEGRTASLDVRLAWAAAHRIAGLSDHSLYVIEDIDGLGDPWVGFTLEFTVEDPERIGYRFDLGSSIRGYLGAKSKDVDQNVDAFAYFEGFDTDVDTGRGPMDPDMNKFNSVFYAPDPPGGPTQSLLVGSDEADLGRFFGTRTFSVTLTGVVVPWLLNPEGEARGVSFARFGLSPTRPFLAGLGYPSSDGEDASQHGLFFNVDITYGLAPVPEPTSAALTLLGLAAIALRRRLQNAVS